MTIENEMKLVIGSRGSGRTTELLLWLLDGHARGVDRVLIVYSESERVALGRKLYELWKDSNEEQSYINVAANAIYSISSWRHQLKMSGGKSFHAKPEIAVADADLFLQELLGLHRRPSIISLEEPIGVLHLPDNNPED